MQKREGQGVGLAALMSIPPAVGCVLPGLCNLIVRSQSMFRPTEQSVFFLSVETAHSAEPAVHCLTGLISAVDQAYSRSHALRSHVLRSSGHRSHVLDSLQLMAMILKIVCQVPGGNDSLGKHWNYFLFYFYSQCNSQSETFITQRLMCRLILPTLYVIKVRHRLVFSQSHNTMHHSQKVNSKDDLGIKQVSDSQAVFGIGLYNSSCTQ
jgi:hypothetical protein